MRSTRLSKYALAVAATGALVLLPAGAAFAGSGPATPAPANVRHSTAPSAAGNPASVKAQAAGVCSDAVEIGTKGTITYNGATVASVKQFYSKKCNQNYGYLWVWDGFRNGAKPYDVTLGVYSYTTDTVTGAGAWKGTTQQEFWTTGTPTVSQCTSAVGTLRPKGVPQPAQAYSTKRC